MGKAKKDWRQEAGEGLVWALKEGNLGLAETLLGSGASVEERGEEQETALHVAARAGLREMVERLLEAGAEIGAGRRRCTRSAVAGGGRRGRGWRAGCWRRGRIRGRAARRGRRRCIWRR